MTNRADIIITVLAITSVVLLLGAVVVAVIGNMAAATFIGTISCYFILCPIFLEIYSHRG